VTDKPDMEALYRAAMAELAQMKRTLAERAKNVAALEKQLMRQVEQGAREVHRPRRATPPAPEPKESDLTRAIAAAEAEKALAQAERERLEERERNIHRVERELAGLRVELEKEWLRLTGKARTPSARPAQSRPAESRPARRS
jgi:hypothetical protein